MFDLGLVRIEITCHAEGLTDYWLIFADGSHALAMHATAVRAMLPARKENAA